MNKYNVYIALMVICLIVYVIIFHIFLNWVSRDKLIYLYILEAGISALGYAFSCLLITVSKAEIKKCLFYSNNWDNHLNIHSYKHIGLIFRIVWVAVYLLSYFLYCDKNRTEHVWLEVWFTLIPLAIIHYLCTKYLTFDELKDASTQLKNAYDCLDKENYTEAIRWVRMAAEQGDKDAQYNLATCYEDGVGVEEDLAKAVKWYRKAAEQGDKDAKEALERLNVK